MNGRRIFAAVTVGHLGIDIFNSMGPVLLAFLQAPLGLSAAQIGLAVGLFQVLAGTTQPAFGWLVDRVGSRFLGPFSVAFNLACMALAVYAAAATGRFLLFLVPFALAAVASGAFHPLGVMHSSTVNLARSATFTAIFFFCGQLGLTTGPLLAGLALDRAGLNGIYWLVFLALPVPVFMAFAMGPRRLHRLPGQVRSADETLPAAAETPASRRRPVRGGVIALLALVFASRSWAMFGTMAFLPLLLSQQGYSSSAQGLASGLFLLGGAVTAVLAGAWADRWGRRPVVFLTTLLGSLLLALVPGSGSLIFAVVLPCGALLGASHSILIVMAQELLPWRRGLASGTALGFLFATGGLATWGIGGLADRFELASVLQAGAVVGLASACASLLLPKREPSRLSAAPAVSTVLVVALAGMALLWPRPASAGLNGEINGQVRDAATDVPLPGAEIRITGDQLHSTQTVRAGRGGSFRAPGLPPGDYYVEATLDGYATSVVENLILVAGGVLRVDFHMRAGSESALDLVSSPLLDVVTGSDGNVLAGDDLRQLPGAVAALNLDLASGLDALDPDVAVNGWPPGFAVYRIDGQESALREPGSAAIDPRWVDQVRVWTMELAATMAGPHIDLVTRSGGTNWRVNGGWSTVEPLDNGERLALRLFAAGESPAGGRDRRRIEGDEATVFAGGPLRDKRARAFGGYSRNRTRGTESLFGAGAPMTWDETIEQSVGKLDWWAGSASNLTLKHHAGSGDLDGRRPALQVLPSLDGTGNDRSRRQTTSLNVEWGVTDRLWLRVFGGRSDLIEDGDPWQHAGLYFGAPAPGRPAGWYEAAPAGRVRRAAERRNWAIEPSFFLFDHTLEIGIQDSRSSLELLRSGGFGRMLRFPGGVVDAWSGGPLGTAGLRQEKRALYVQDAWRVGGAFKRHLTLHAGLRAEEEEAGPLDLEFEDRTEPRLAFVWDVAGRGRWKVYGGAAWWHVDVFRPRAGRSDLDAVAVLEGTGGFSGARLDFARATADPDLRPARVREIQLGTGYQFLPDVVVSARVSRRRLRDGIRLMPLVVAGEIAPTLLTPGRGAGSELPQLEQDWWGAEFNANVGFSPSWRIHFSYLLSRLTGNHEAGGLGLEAGTLPGAHPVLAGLDLCSSPVPCDVFDVTDDSRRLSLDREHQLSGWLVLSPGERWLMALVYRFRAGAAYVPRALTVRADEAGRILSTGLTPLPSGRDAPVKSADLKRADLSLTYRVPLRSDDRRLSLFAEALNVFDQDAANQLWPLAWLDPVLVGPDRTDLLAAAATQGARPDLRESLPAAFQTSRRVRAGLRLQF
ncbi:MAG: MFS transporter [Acidobacteria bacterium]|nr:MFS transporter [Acidobacteriota bacterium]